MKASETIDYLFKIASYLKPIKCKGCGYEGKPDGVDGRCPKCGLMCGVLPVEKANPYKEAPFSREQSLNEFYSDVERSIQDTMSYYN